MDFTGERMIPEHNKKNLIYGEHLLRYLFAAQFANNKTVLDIASGSGYGSDIIAKQNAKLVCGVDISEEAIIYSKKNYHNNNLEFKVGNAENIPYEDVFFDTLVSFETIEHLNDYQKFLKETKRVLKKDGIAIISTPNKSVYPEGNPYHIKEFYIDEFKEELEKYFKYVQIEYQDNFVSNIIYQSEKDFEKNSSLFEFQENEPLYIIAICSDLKIPEYKKINFTFHSNEVGSGMLKEELKERTEWAQQLDKEILNKNALIQQLQQESKKRTEWSKRLDKEIEEKNKRILELQQEVEEKNIWARNLNLEIENLKTQKIERKGAILSLSEELGNTMTELEQANADLEQANTELEQAVADLGKTMALLTTAEEEVIELNKKNDYLWFEFNNQKAEIARIKNGLSFRLGRILTWPLRFLCPPQSKRKFICKMFLNALKNPIKFLKVAKPKNIKKFLKASKQDDPDILLKKFDDHLNQRNLTARTTGEKNSDIDLFDEETDTTNPLEFKKYDEPLVSIIIPVYNNWGYNYRCLLSILKNTHPDISYEIIIADDCSTDTTKDIQKYIKNIKVARPEQNLRFLKNCNNAAKQAEGKYLLFLNNDTQVQKGWLKSLVDLIENDESIGMVGSKLVYPDVKLQEAGGIIWKDASGWNFGRLGNPKSPEFNYVKETDYISGAAIMLSKKLWEEIGGFDELFVPAYCEDSDLAFEVRKHGYKVVYQPNSVVVHFEGISHGTDETSGLKQYQIVNKEKFLNKWKDVLEKEHFENGQEVFWARDKSQHKKTILIIDHYVPHFDKDAGSRTMYQYIKLLVKMGYNVKFLGDNFYKHEPYTNLLEQIGVEVLYGDWCAKHWQEWMKENAKYIDFVYLNRGHIAIKYSDFIKEHLNAKIIYNAVDFSFLREMRQYEITKNPKYLEQATQSKNREMKIFNQSDIIITISEYEKEMLKRELPNKQITVIPTFIYEGQFPLSENSNLNNRPDITFIGGFKHQPNEDGILWFLEKIYPTIQKTISQAKINIIGSNPTEKILNLKSETINVTGFISDEELKDYYSKTRVVIAPLRFGAGVKGKIIEAIAQGIPVVTTPIGAEGIKEGKTILQIADNEEEFAKKIITTYQNETEWEQIRNAEIDYSNKFLSTSHAREIIKEIF